MFNKKAQEIPWWVIVVALIALLVIGYMIIGRGQMTPLKMP